MADSPSFDRLLSGVHKGDKDQSAELIVKRFGSRLAALAAARISQKLRRRVGAEDVVQSTFKTFFRRLDNGMLELRDWESLWGMLARIALRRICRQAEHNGAAKRSMDRETPLPEELAAIDRLPGPEDVLVAVELCEQLTARLPERHRAIFRELLAGASHEEIAKELETSISTVERVQRRVRELAEGIGSEEG